MQNRILFFIFFGLCAIVFWDCKNTRTPETDLSTEETILYLEKGKAIAATTFSTLSQQLQKAMKAGGVPNAIQYCNLAAYSITDSLSQVNQAKIRRTSSNYRNNKNAPTPFEKEILATYANQFSEGISMKPIVKAIDKHNIAFFAPISVNDFCLKCHGQLGTSLATSDYQIIQKYYPDDKAIGYEAGDLRGMWSITFKKE